jgi:hypothetical protein
MRVDDFDQVTGTDTHGPAASGRNQNYFFVRASHSDLRFASTRSGGEQLGWYVPEGLELQRIAGGIQQEHRGLLAGLSGKSNIGAMTNATFWRRNPCARRVHSANSNTTPQCGTGTPWPSTGLKWAVTFPVGPNAGFEMTHELMPIEIEVHPLFGAPPFGAAEDFPIELPCLVEVSDLHGDMKWRQGLHVVRPPRTAYCKSAIMRIIPR